MRWSRKPEVTDYKADMRTIPRVVWRCVQVEKYSFCIVIVKVGAFTQNVDISSE